MLPRRGEYYVISNDEHKWVDRVIFPVPTAKGKGVLAIPTVAILSSVPTAKLDEPATTATVPGAAYIRENISKIINDAPPTNRYEPCRLETEFDVSDFIIGPLDVDNPGFYKCCID